jgi:hypothetical protein
MEVVEYSNAKNCARLALTWLFLLIFVGACSEEPTQQGTNAGQQAAQTVSAPDSHQYASEQNASTQSPATAVSEPALSTAGGQAVEPATSESEHAHTAAASDSEPPLDASVQGSNTEEPQTVSTVAPDFLVSGYAGSIYWEPNVAKGDAAFSDANTYAHLDLKLSSPTGKLIQQRFQPGEPVGLSAEQGVLPDGLYKWETVAVPTVDPQVRAEMVAVRESGDFTAEQALIARLRGRGMLPTEAQARSNVQSGHFTIRGGEMVRGDVAEH